MEAHEWALVSGSCGELGWGQVGAVYWNFVAGVRRKRFTVCPLETKIGCFVVVQTIKPDFVEK